MTNAFGLPADASQHGTLTAWCNLCRSQGREFVIDADVETWAGTMEVHTALAHPEHNAALQRGEAYEPVEVRL